jgi:hypothetical protein
VLYAVISEKEKQTSNLRSDCKMKLWTFQLQRSILVLTIFDFGDKGLLLEFDQSFEDIGNVTFRWITIAHAFAAKVRFL